MAGILDNLRDYGESGQEGSARIDKIEAALDLANGGIQSSVNMNGDFAKNAAKPTEQEQEFLQKFEANREMHAKGFDSDWDDMQAQALDDDLLEAMDDLGTDRHPAVEAAFQEVLDDPQSFGVEAESNFITALQGEHDFDDSYVSRPENLDM